MRIFLAYFLPCLFILMDSLSIVIAEEDGEARLYTTREEKREAGIKHEVFPWFVTSGLAEFEWLWQKQQLDDLDENNIADSLSANVQGSFFITPFDWVKTEIITDYDTDTNELIVDEAEMAFEYRQWELAFGKMYLPFGVFFSHFANGPIIEFGETRATSVALNYNYGDITEFSLATYRSKARKINSSNRIDWSAGLETWPLENLSLGISFISDLADSDQRLLESNMHRYRNKVPAASAYVLWVAEQYEISLEILGAFESFDELEPDRNQPLAANLEFTHFISNNLDWSFRLEGSHELEDAPEIQFGLAVNYKILDNIFITVEGLHGYYRNNLATDDAGNNLESITTFNALISVGF